MSATITSSGTWTPLGFTTRDALKTGDNARRLNDLNLQELGDADLPELEQIVNLVAAGYGISNQSARQLLFICMKASLQRDRLADQNAA